MRRLLALSILAALLPAGPAAGESADAPGTAVLRVAPASATVGDRIEAVLEVTVPEGTSVERPDPGRELGPFAVSGPTWEGPVLSEGKAKYTLRARLAAFETGTLEVPAIEVRVRRGEEASVLKSEPVRVEVTSVLGEEAAGTKGEADIADLKPPASMPAQYRPLVVALLILAGLLAAAAAAWWLHRRLAPRLAAVAAPDDPFHRQPPHVWAYAELQKLLERRLADEDETGTFFAELSRILKLYLGGRYRIPLMERTTGEIPDLLKEAGAPADAIRSSRALLERADGVKFAREAADPSLRRASVEEAYRIVDATRPAEEPAPAEKGAA